MVEILTLKSDSELYIGAPATRLPRPFFETIIKIISQFGEITEAHLPQCYIQGFIEPSAQVLVIVLDPADDPRLTVEALVSALEVVFPHPSFLRIWPMSEEHAALHAVRAAGCKILSRR